MDTLVAQYSKPMFEKENSEEDQLELYQGTPNLSLRFAMPPVAQVRQDPLSHIFFNFSSFANEELNVC
jgi:hypothetical protein